MNTFARTAVAIALIALPGSAFAKTKSAHSSNRPHAVAKKDSKKQGKHHSHKSATAKPAADKNP
jgi:hypothetical protein